MDDRPFWQRKSLAEMSAEEWESLCDGCGKCCLVKLEDEDTGEISYTDIACRLLDTERCRCRRYRERQRHVPDCVVLTPSNIEEIRWMPSTCAYRLRLEGKDLPWWHHLVSGDRQLIHQVGASARGRVVSERDVAPEEYEDRIVDWSS